MLLSARCDGTQTQDTMKWTCLSSIGLNIGQGGDSCV